MAGVAPPASPSAVKAELVRVFVSLGAAALAKVLLSAKSTIDLSVLLPPLLHQSLATPNAQRGGGETGAVVGGAGGRCGPEGGSKQRVQARA